MFDHIGITHKGLWNTLICVCVKYSLRGNQRVNLDSEGRYGTILRPGGHAEPTKVGGVSSVWYQSSDFVCIFQEEGSRGKGVV
jgi:hypothetical protein